jgi:hypothetical protein
MIYAVSLAGDRVLLRGVRGRSPHWGGGERAGPSPDPGFCREGSLADLFRLETLVADTPVAAPRPGGGTPPAEGPEVTGFRVLTMTMGSTAATIDGREVTLAVAPRLVGGRTAVPLRWLGEAIGARLQYDPAERRITYTLGELTVVLWVGKEEALVNGQPSTVSPAPFVDPEAGTTLVPLRFVAAALGGDIQFDATTGRITVRFKVKQIKP